jgi:hypothetical protein
MLTISIWPYIGGVEAVRFVRLTKTPILKFSAQREEEVRFYD